MSIKKDNELITEIKKGNRKVSSSLMDSIEWCERKFRIKEIEGIPSGRPPHPALPLGKVSHKEIHKFWSVYRLNLDTYILDIEKYYKNTVRTTKGLSKENYIKFQLYFSNFINFQIRRIKYYIKKYGDNYKLIEKLFFPILSEKYGNIKIVGDIRFAFIIDALFWNPKGNNLIDWKTDKDCNESKFKEHIPQLNRYSRCLYRIGQSCEKIGIFFLKESLYFNEAKTVNYSLEKEILNFIRRIQVSKFPKVPKKEKWKCHNEDLTYTCEYYPDICRGVE